MTEGIGKPPVPAEPLEWIDEPLGRGVRAGMIQLFRFFCLIASGICVAVGLLGFVARWPELVAWVLLGAGAVLIGLGMRFSLGEVPERLGLGREAMVFVGAGGGEAMIAYSAVLGLEHSPGATDTARLRYRSGPSGIGATKELLLDRKVADRVMARVSAR